MLLKLAALVLALATAGCASYCSDGTTSSSVQLGPVGMGSSTYHRCNEKCLDPADPLPCGCSRLCPCWLKHQ